MKKRSVSEFLRAVKLLSYHFDNKRVTLAALRVVEKIKKGESNFTIWEKHAAKCAVENWVVKPGTFTASSETTRKSVSHTKHGYHALFRTK